MVLPNLLREMPNLVSVCFVTDYLSVKPDFVGEYAAPVMKHMNDDHGDATAAMVRHYVGIPVSFFMSCVRA